MTDPKDEYTEDSKINHMQMIQGVINRMAQNSFALKGWLVTIVAALFIFFQKDNNQKYFLIALIPTFAFWGLDAYYLKMERSFRHLFDAKRIMSIEKLSENPFDMDFTKYEKKEDAWLKIVKSKSVFWYYFPIVIILIVASLNGELLKLFSNIFSFI